VIDGVARAYRKAIETKLREREEFIASGKAQSFEEYRGLCGKQAGLKEALELFNDVVKSHGRLEDDE